MHSKEQKINISRSHMWTVRVPYILGGRGEGKGKLIFASWGGSLASGDPAILTLAQSTPPSLQAPLIFWFYHSRI